MKHARLIVITTALMLSAFAAIIVSSCKKSEPCSGVVCNNSGTCVNGKCSCPTGYSGTFCENAEQSSIVYINNTFTTMNMMVNDTKYKVPVGGTVAYPAQAGTTVTVSATTAYTNTAGKVVGEIISWSFIDTLPANGAYNHPLNVDPSYFYLKIANGDNYDTIVSIQVNYQTTNETTDSMLIPNDGTPYIIGYYKAFTGTKIYVTGKGQSLTGSSWTLTPYIPYTINSTAIATVP